MRSVEPMSRSSDAEESIRLFSECLYSKEAVALSSTGKVSSCIVSECLRSGDLTLEPLAYEGLPTEPDMGTEFVGRSSPVPVDGMLLSASLECPSDVGAGAVSPTSASLCRLLMAGVLP